MECNRDEASRAKEIAEKKFTAKDITGAKKIALKAQNLFPGLEGIPQLLATLDVYVAAENKINGEADWYGILGADPRSDDDTVRKQYRKLALMLHPDKNKSVGADGAFKLLSEAWSLLSDKSKRAAYDQKRNVKVHQNVAASSGVSHANPPANGFYNFAKSTTSSTKTQKTNTQKNTTRAGRASAPAQSQKPRPSTFWTVCQRCKMQYEYLRIYLNHNLLCPNCHEPFLAVEIAPPPTNGCKNSSQQRHNQTASKNTSNTGRSSAASANVGAAGFNGHESYNQNSFQWGPFSKGSGTSTAAQAASVVQQAYEKAKREREEAQAATKREEVLRRKNQVSKKASGTSSTGYPNAAKRRRGMDNVGVSNYEGDVTNQTGVGAGAAYSSGYKQAGFESGKGNGNTRPSIRRDFTLQEIQKMQKEKARREILKKLTEYSVAKTAAKETGNRNERPLESIDLPKDGNKSDEPVDTKNDDSDRKISKQTLETLSISVPDPDFHDFDKDRSEKCFGENQVWSAYDRDDGMPRYYALVHNVISEDPFRMQISWLNSKTNSELGPLNWVASGFSKTCGEFRVGKYEVNKSLNSFSHKVRWTKGPRGSVCIYPKKGDIWALYRNWSPNWNELTADDVIHKYDMVEIVDDFSEDLGIQVTPLVKVAGFKTVFHRHLDPRETRRIPRDEMFRFSHHVPSHLLTGQEAPNAPKGCRELDPAATPMELLQVIEDVKDEEASTEGEKWKEVIVVDDVENRNEELEMRVNSSPVREKEKGG